MTTATATHHMEIIVQPSVGLGVQIDAYDGDRHLDVVEGTDLALPDDTDHDTIIAAGLAWAEANGWETTSSAPDYWSENGPVWVVERTDAATEAVTDANRADAAHGPITISQSPDRTGFEYWTLFLDLDDGQESGPIGPDLDPDDEDTAYAIVQALRDAGYNVRW